MITLHTLMGLEVILLSVLGILIYMATTLVLNPSVKSPIMCYMVRFEAPLVMNGYEKFLSPENLKGLSLWLYMIIIIVIFIFIIIIIIIIIILAIVIFIVIVIVIGVVFVIVIVIAMLSLLSLPLLLLL